MAPPQQARVLRCCGCSLFQAHQVKKSLKWTCKACGKKQSFLQAYGEGSGADCRRHVQKLNLLQGQISEMSLRSLGDSISANEEENVGPWQAASAGPQEKPQPSKNRWLKYLERDSEELGLKEGLCFNRQPSSGREKPDPPFSTGLPRKRCQAHHQSSLTHPHLTAPWFGDGQAASTVGREPEACEPEGAVSTGPWPGWAPGAEVEAEQDASGGAS